MQEDVLLENFDLFNTRLIRLPQLLVASNVWILLAQLSVLSISNVYSWVASIMPEFVSNMFNWSFIPNLQFSNSLQTLTNSIIIITLLLAYKVTPAKFLINLPISLVSKLATSDKMKKISNLGLDKN